MTGPPRRSTAAADRGGRAGAWAVVAVAVAALVAFGALYVLLRDPILVGLGRLAGPSRPGAVALGWALWALPLAITVVSAARWPKGLPRRARWALATVIAASWLPAALLFPTSRGGAAQALAEALVRDAPDVAAAIFAGIVAGLLSTIAGAGAWMVVGGLRGNRLGLACCAAASLLGLGGALALHGHGPRGHGAQAFLPAAA
ncbi:MAG: hypothetical protein QOK40_2671, partial [Miltoncostaeaceae bacterium]|nr:hypothetical protein [Miltoncostaeaceae bacterium]